MHRLKVEVPQNCNMVSNSYSKFRGYFVYSLAEVEQMLSDQQWIDFSLSANADRVCIVVILLLLPEIQKSAQGFPSSCTEYEIEE